MRALMVWEHPFRCYEWHPAAEEEDWGTVLTAADNGWPERPEFPIYYDAQGREHEVF